MKRNRLAILIGLLLLGSLVGWYCLREKAADSMSVASSSDVSSPSAPRPSSGASFATAAAPSASGGTNQTATVRGTRPYVVASVRPFTVSLRRAAEATGARTVSVLSPNRLLVEATPSVHRRLAADSRFESVTEFLPSSKISPGLAAEIAAGATSVDVTLITLSSEDRSRVIDRILAFGGELLKGHFNGRDNFRARLSPKTVAALADYGDVRWMEKFVRPHLMNDKAVEPGAMNVRPAWLSDANPEGLSGAGQIVSTSDSGIDTGNLETLHEDLRDRIVGIRVVEGGDTSDLLGHGTHTAGSIVGTGVKSGGKIRGTAWGAQLYAWFCGMGGGTGLSLPPTLDDLYRPDQESYPTYIHSASWGANTAGAYDADCYLTDKYVWEHPDFLPVYSAGNEGRSGRGTVGSPAASKNVLAVGATQNLRTDKDTPEGVDGWWKTGDAKVTAEYSSRGPCKDGRIKPDVAAPGSAILSTRSSGVDYSYGNYNEFYAYDFGTSMACPLTAGSVALVREWLMRRGEFAATPPSAALMKAIVTGGAKGAATPGNEQGWGRVDLSETLAPSDGRAVRIIDRVPYWEDSEVTYAIVTTNDAPLEVQLVWIDHAGDPSVNQAEPKLVNDLDLIVQPSEISPTVWYGNGGKTADTVNNLESVRIASAEPRTYLITVVGSRVLFDSTEGGAAALYIRGAFDPDAEEPDFARVRVRQTDDEFLSFERALKAAKEVTDETPVLEILKPVPVGPGSIVFDSSVMLWCGEAEPTNCPMLLKEGTALSVAGGARLTLDNVALCGLSETKDVSEMIGGTIYWTNKTVVAELNPLAVAAGGQVAVQGKVSLPEIVTSDADGFVIAGPLSNGITLRAPGIARGAKGGVYECPQAAAAASVAYVTNPQDPFLQMVATAGGSLVWDLKPIADDEVVATLELEGGGGVDRYASLDRLIQDLKPNATVVLRRTDVLSRPHVVTNGCLRLLGDAQGGPATVEGQGLEAGFEIGDGGSVVVSNIVFRKYTGKGLFRVNGEGARLSLVGQTVIERAEGTGSWSGAVSVEKGEATIADGSRLENCFANGYGTATGKGGGVSLVGEGCTLNLKDAKVLNCRARWSNGGGGVYAGAKSTVNLSGATYVTGNMSGGPDGRRETNNLFVANAKFSDSRANVNLVGELTGTVDRYHTVGVSYQYDSSSSAYGNGEGRLLCNVACPAEAAEKSLAAIFNDTSAALEAVVSADGAALAWQLAYAGPRLTPTDDPVLKPDVARIVRSETVTNYFHKIEDALLAVDETNLVVEVLQNTRVYTSVTVPKSTTIRRAPSAPADTAVRRAALCGFVVPAGVTLTVSNLVFYGCNGDEGKLNPDALFSVKGGGIVLGEGAVIRDVDGDADRSAGAVEVYDGGTVTLNPGASILNCTNRYVNVGNATGVGAGILVDTGTAYLNGGTVSGCCAYRAAGVFVGNGGAAYVKGPLTIAGNRALDGRASDFVTATHLNTTRCLSGELVGDVSVGIEDGIRADTNVFGQVDAAYEGDLTALTNSAAKFFRDDNPNVRGLLATNGADAALLVWRTAVFEDEEGIWWYRGASGSRYRVLGEVGELPEPPAAEDDEDDEDSEDDEEAEPPAETLDVPPLQAWSVVTNAPTPIALKSMRCVSASQWELVFTNRVEYCNYRLIWTDNLAKGFTSTGAWEHAVGPAADPVWTTNVLMTGGGSWFWRAEGTEGTNMVPPQVEQ